MPVPAETSLMGPNPWIQNPDAALNIRLAHARRKKVEATFGPGATMPMDFTDDVKKLDVRAQKLPAPAPLDRAYTEIAEKHGPLVAEQVFRRERFLAGGEAQGAVAKMTPQELEARAAQGKLIYDKITQGKHEWREMALENPEQYGAMLAPVLDQAIYPNATVEPWGSPRDPGSQWKITTPRHWDMRRNRNVPESTAIISGPQFQTIVRGQDIKALSRTPTAAELAALSVEARQPPIPGIEKAPEKPIVVHTPDGLTHFVSPTSGQDMFTALEPKSPTRQQLSDMADIAAAKQGIEPGGVHHVFHGGFDIAMQNGDIISTVPLVPPKTPPPLVVDNVDDPETKLPAKLFVWPAVGDKPERRQYFPHSRAPLKIPPMTVKNEKGEYGTWTATQTGTSPTGAPLYTGDFLAWPKGQVPANVKEPVPDLGHFQSGGDTVFTVTDPGAEVPRITGTLNKDTHEIELPKAKGGAAAGATAAPASPAAAPIPIPPESEREIGKVYTNKNGKKGIWRGGAVRWEFLP